MIRIKKLEELNNKFYRLSGWSGADGVYSFKVDNRILLYFSDTFIGSSTNDGIRKDFKLINNSLAIMENDKIDFIYNKNPIDSIFIQSDNSYYWLEDGIVENDKLAIFALNMKNDVFSSVPFEINGIDIIHTTTSFAENMKYEIQKTNLYADNIIWGISIIKEDGYYYVFGYKNTYGNKCLVLSRTKDLKTYEYLNSIGLFSSNNQDLLVLKEHFEAESKVFKVNSYYYIAYTKDSISSEIYLIRAKSIFKPFNEEIKLYTCPEHKDSIITYNAKIQDALSNEERLIISYNVNTLVNSEHKYLDIYRPRFIEINLKEIDDEFENLF